VAPTTRLANLSREPYRPLFPLAMVLGLAGLVVWTLALQGQGTAMTVSLHGLVFVWGFLGTAVLGFFFTAFPRQNDAAQPSPRAVLATALVQIVFVSLGLSGHGKAAVAVGALLWVPVATWASIIAIPSLRRQWDGTSAGAPIALVLAAAGLLSWPWFPGLAAEIGVIGFLVPMALLLLDRVLPFFSRKRFPSYSGGRSPGFMPALLLSVLARLALRDTHVAVAAADLCLAAVLLRQWVGWRPDQTWREPMIGVLHLGVVWLIAAPLVDAVQALNGAPVGMLSRHLWTIGGMTTLLIGFSIRVVRGGAALGPWWRRHHRLGSARRDLPSRAAPLGRCGPVVDPRSAGWPAGRCTAGLVDQPGTRRPARFLRTLVLLSCAPFRSPEF